MDTVYPELRHVPEALKAGEISAAGLIERIANSSLDQVGAVASAVWPSHSGGSCPSHSGGRCLTPGCRALFTSVCLNFGSPFVSSLAGLRLHYRHCVLQLDSFVSGTISSAALCLWVACFPLCVRAGSVWHCRVAVQVITCHLCRPDAVVSCCSPEAPAAPLQQGRGGGEGGLGGRARSRRGDRSSPAPGGSAKAFLCGGAVPEVW